MTQSNDLSDRLFNHLLRGTAFSMPATTWVGLHTADPTRVTATALANEVSGGSYVRLQITRAQWGASANGIGNPTIDLIWPVASAPWGTLSYVSLWDGDVGGATPAMYLAKGALVTPQAIIAGGQFIIRSSQLTAVLL